MIEGCDGCGKDTGCECGVIMSVFHEANRKLAEMDILDRMTCDVITKVRGVWFRFGFSGKR